MGEQFPRKFGNYHLLKPLAQGGMGALYLAVRGDRGLERLLVIKTVLPHLADVEYTARFRDEAKVVVKLSHGNLIPVFDAGAVDDELFLAMEFVEGRDLRAIWNRCAKRQVAFPVDVAVYIVKELCRGLAYAHAFGDLNLVHRDISPPNILVSFAGEVKLTDFGLASSKLKLEKTAPGIIYGKVAYMSPEQARGEELDGSSDLYAAAIVLWELLTGRQLFPPGKEQSQDLLQRARNPLPLAPSKKAPRVPPALDAICLKALAPVRKERYPGCDEFREALSGWLASAAPRTDASRIETFLAELFTDDIARDRGEREELLSSLRKRAKTLPPDDELRRLLEADTDVTALDGKFSRTAGSVGRRAADRGTPDGDRRQRGDRREGDAKAGDIADRAPADRARLLRADTDVGGDSPSEPEIEVGGSGAATAGQVIDARYRVRKLIGEGGMGKVYMAEHVDIGRVVAVKILHPVYGRLPDLVERFRREAQAASTIGNPHIVDVTDFGKTDDGSVYFVMEYLDGIDLGSVIEREGAIDVRRALHVGVQICRALSAAHAASIIHRDLKPENIFLIEREGVADFVKVLDFGVARSMQIERAKSKRLTSPGMAMGTPEYMAPEQAAGKPADVRCDIYAVGAILYEALTGMAPYDGDNFMEVLTKKATQDPSDIRSLRAGLPASVATLIERAMARRSEDRPASMETFEYELTKCLSGRGRAVAKVLGMTADPKLAAKLNPGMPAGESAHGPAAASGPPPPSPAAGAATIPPPASMITGEATANVRAPSGVPRWAIAGSIAVAILLVFGVGGLLFWASSPTPTKPPDAAARVLASDADAGAEVAVNPPSDAAVADVSPPDPPDPAIDAAPAPPPDATKKPVEGGPTTAAQFLARANARARNDQWKPAQSDYQQAFARAGSGKQRREAKLGLAQAAFETQDTAGMIKHAQWVLDNGDPNHKRARLFVAQGKERLRDWLGALRYYDKLVQDGGSERIRKQALSGAKRVCKNGKIKGPACDKFRDM